MILSALISLIFTYSAYAQVPAICSNLSAVTCTEGVRRDATGETKNADSVRYANEEYQRLQPAIRNAFERMLATLDGEELTPFAMDACRLNKMPDCKRQRSSVCKKLIVTCFSELYKTTENDPSLAVLYKEDSKEIKFFNAEAALVLVQEPAFVRTADAITREATGKIPKELEAKVEKELIPTVQTIMRQKIRELPIDEQTRQRLDAKIAAAEYEGLECKKPRHASQVDYGTGLLGALYPNAYYDSDSNEFSFCPAYLRNSSSEFDLVAIIAHELAHAIDPCKIGGGNPFEGDQKKLSEAFPDKTIEDRYLRKDFLSCLRSDSSIGAKSFRMVNPPIAGAEKHVIANGLHRVCQSDQINEATADWFAAEALAAYLPLRNAKVKPPLTQSQVQVGMSNVFRSACSAIHNNPSSRKEHPTTHKRLNNIFLTQPKLREMMGCPSRHATNRYCDISNPSSLAESVQAPVPQTTQPNLNRAEQ